MSLRTTLKNTSLSFIFGFAGAFTAMAIAAPSPKAEVVTKKITVQNNQGKPVVIIETDAKGHPRLQLQSDDKECGVVLEVADEAGRGRSCGLVVQNGSHAAAIAASASEARCRVVSGDGKKFAAMRATEKLTEFAIVDGDKVPWRSPQ